jgi:hypothetical protein
MSRLSANYAIYGKLQIAQFTISSFQGSFVESQTQQSAAPKPMLYGQITQLAVKVLMQTIILFTGRIVKGVQ